MNFTFKAFLFLSCLILHGDAAADNPQGTKEKKLQFDLAQFNQIRVTGPFVVDIRESKEQAVTLTGDPAFINLVDVSVKDAVLVVKLQGNHELSSRPRLTVAIPQLTQFYQSGSVRTKISGFSGVNLKLNVRGNGTLNCESEFDRVEISADGSTDIDLRSTNIQHVDVNLVGSIGLKFSKLKSVRGRIVGGAKVSYANPDSSCDVSVEIVGGGKISNRSVVCDSNVGNG